MKLPLARTDIQIRFTDLDLVGHVSNSVYMQYFDMGRLDFFTQIAKTSECPGNVVASVTIDMVKEILLHDKVYVLTWCKKIGTKSMTVQQDIYKNAEIATRATLVLVGFDRETRRSIALPSHWEPSDVAE